MPDEQNITHSYIIDFVRQSLPKSQGLLAELEYYAAKQRVPIIQPEVAGLLRLMCRIHKPKSILEIGCAIGYSALLMHQEAPEGAKITTVERSAAMAQKARSNIAAAGAENSIDVLEADAEVLLPVLDGSYDMIFLDAAKAHYITFLPDCIRLMRRGGLLVSDNVLYGGMVANHELLVRRKITIVKRLKKYLDAICHSSQLASTILSIGDGVALSYKL